MVGIKNYLWPLMYVLGVKPKNVGVWEIWGNKTVNFINLTIQQIKIDLFNIGVKVNILFILNIKI